MIGTISWLNQFNTKKCRKQKKHVSCNNLKNTSKTKQVYYFIIDEIKTKILIIC